MKTAIVVISTVTAPTRTGLATRALWLLRLKTTPSAQVIDGVLELLDLGLALGRVERGRRHVVRHVQRQLPAADLPVGVGASEPADDGAEHAGRHGHEQGGLDVRGGWSRAHLRRREGGRAPLEA